MFDPRSSWSRGCLVLLPLLLASPPARAFTVESPETRECHERMTLVARELAGWPDGAQAPPASPADELLADDLPFDIDDLPGPASDPWSIALLVGVRDNDLAGLETFDLAGLAAVHADPLRQSEH